MFHGSSTAAAAVCLPGGATGAEYALVTFYGQADANGESANANTAVSVLGTGIVPPTPPPAPAPDFVALGAHPVLPARVGDGGFERRLRAREREELRGLVPFARTAQPVAADPAAAGVQISIVRIR